MITPAAALSRYAPHDRGRQWFRVNMVTSIDGAIAVEGTSGGLGDEEDRVIFAAIRSVSDVILVGAGTVRAEGYDGARLPEWGIRWREERGLGPAPQLVILSRSGHLDVTPLGRAEIRPVVITEADPRSAELAGLAEVSDIHQVPDVGDLALVRNWLHLGGHSQILCEGGPTVLGAAYRGDVIDELCLTHSPVLVGPQAPGLLSPPPDARSLNTPRQFRRTDVWLGEELMFLRFERHDKG